MSEEAIPAATLVVMREVAAGPPLLLMVTRPAKMVFAGGAMVFPGGRVDPADRAIAADDLGAARIAAIRETIEETGVSVGVAGIGSDADGHSLQEALHRGDGLAALVERHGLELQPEALVPFARWKPAFLQPRRFDTLFFLARAPEGEIMLRPQPGECDSAEWLSAAEVLERIANGTAAAIFPTVRNLERLALHGSFDDAVADARAHPMETITPWIEDIDGERWIKIPGHLGYPITAERLNDAVRA